MADQKISALTEVTAPAASDMMPIVNAATTKKVQVQNAVKAVPAIWARVFHNTSQSIPNNTVTAVTFNSERWDTDVIHDNATNNSRLTCKTAGVYAIGANVRFASNATGMRSLRLRLNGVTDIAEENRTALSGVATVFIVFTEYPLVVNDYIEVSAFQNSGGSLNIEQDGTYLPEFMMVRIGA